MFKYDVEKKLKNYYETEADSYKLPNEKLMKEIPDLLVTSAERNNPKMKIRNFYKNYKKTAVTVTVIACVLMCYCIYALIPNKYKIVYSDALYAFDISDYRQLAVYNTYIFVGRVNNLDEYEYRDHGFVCSKYYVTPLMNIQGDLKTGQKLLWKKEGGLTKDRLYYSLLSGDIIPEEGKLYFICTRATDDGSILFSSGANSAIELEKGIIEDNLSDSEIVNKMIAACESPNYYNGFCITPSTTRSKYDAKTKPVFSMDELKNSQRISKTLNETINNSELPYYPDDEELAEFAGNYNYFFVGKITKEGQFGISKEGYAYVEYTVLPIFSIIDGTARKYREQQFVKDIEIPFIKYGALTIYDDGVELIRDDIFPEVDKLYMFTCTSTYDGTKLYSYSPYAVVPLEQDITEDNITDSLLVKRYTEARKNPATINNPIFRESGNYQRSDYTIYGYIEYLRFQEIELAEKEGREPVFNYDDEIYQFPDYLI